MVARPLVECVGPESFVGRPDHNHEGAIASPSGVNSGPGEVPHTLVKANQKWASRANHVSACDILTAVLPNPLRQQKTERVLTVHDNPQISGHPALPGILVNNVTGLPLSSAIGSCMSMGSFDHYARLAKRLLRAPASLVSIVEAKRQIFPGAVGLVETLMSSRQTPIAYSFCQYVVEDAKPLVVSDARNDPRLQSNPAIEEFDVIAYVGYPLTDATGQTVGSLAALDSVPRAWSTDDLDVLQDLALACSAELQHARQIAEDGEQLARSIFATTDIALAFYDSNHELVMANEPAHRVAEVGRFRIDESPYGGGHAYRAGIPTPLPLHEQIIPRSLSGELERHELHTLGPPGKQIVVSASARQVERTDGSPWGTLVAMQDVTDLARALQVKDELIATVSHELRTPLTSVLGYVEILADEFEGAEGFVPDALGTIERAALSLQSRIDELLDSGVRRWAVAPETTDVGELARRVAARFALTASSGAVDLAVTGEDSCLADVDPARFEQVLENLISNALKFTPHGGQVTVVVRASHDEVLVEVVDTGIGMTEDEVVQAFDTFWRSDGARLAAIQGFGIGLTVVRCLVEAHQGSVAVSSEPGRGTTVAISIPRCTGDPELARG